VATWKLVSGEVAKAVRNGNKELWAALKRSTAQIEHLRADSNRLEARVDAQGQCNERTAMAVASLRVAGRSGGGSSGSRKESGSRTGTAADAYKSVSAATDVNDITPIVKSDEARVAAMALAPDNDAKAASLRRPLRAAVKSRVATTTVSREVLMDADTATDVIQEEVVKAYSLTPAVANSYLMNRVYFPSTVKGSVPVKKRPVSVIMTTIPHTVAQLREFVLKPFFKVLGFSYNPMPVNKARKWSKKDLFLTSYKGEKAVVAAAKNLMTKIGGGARIIKSKTAGSRYHVEMVVGHHALIASFVSNEFEIALGNRTRRRGGNGSSSYFHWVDEFSASISHLAKNHKGKNIHSGYRIMDDIDPNVVLRTRTGWVFSESAAACPAGKAPAAPSLSTPATSAPAPTSGKRAGSSSTRAAADSSVTAALTPRGGASSRGVGTTRRRAAEHLTATRNGADDFGVDRDDDGRAAARKSQAPAGVVIVVDDTADNADGAALVGLREEGAASDGGGGDARASTWRRGYGAGSDVGGSDDGGSDEGGSDSGESDSGESDSGESGDTGARTSSSDSDDSDAGADSSDEAGESGGLGGDGGGAGGGADDDEYDVC